MKQNVETEPAGPEVFVATRLGAPVLSGEEGSGDNDLRPIQVVPEAALPAGAVIINKDVEIIVRPFPPR